MEFSIYRIGLLIKKQWAENRQLYFFGLLATAGIMALAFLLHSTAKRGLAYGDQQAVLVAGLMLGGGVFTSTILTRFNDKVKGIYALTLPASATEKLATALIYTMLLYPVVFLIAVYPVMAIANYIDNEMLGNINSLYIVKWDDALKIIPGYAVLQSAILICMVLFKRYALVKTIVLIAVVFFGMIGLNPFIAGKMLDLQGEDLKAFNATVEQRLYNDDGRLLKDSIAPLRVAGFRISNVGPYGSISMYNRGNVPVQPVFNMTDPHYSQLILEQNKVGQWLFTFLIYGAIVFLWLIAWFRLKEIQL